MGCRRPSPVCVLEASGGRAVHPRPTAHAFVPRRPLGQVPRRMYLAAVKLSAIGEPDQGGSLISHSIRLAFLETSHLRMGAGRLPRGQPGSTGPRHFVGFELLALKTLDLGCWSANHTVTCGRIGHSYRFRNSSKRKSRATATEATPTRSILAK